MPGARRIVVVLSSVPSLGGGYTYSESIARALARRQGDQLELRFVCLNAAWGSWAEGLGVSAILCPPMNPWVRRFRRGLIVAGLEFAWRWLRPWCSPLHRELASRPADLAIFPCEPHWSLDSPMPVLAPIHDLMYHYESRFPEVGSGLTRLVRYRLDRAVIRAARGILVDSRIGRQQVEQLFHTPAGKIHVLPYVATRMRLGDDIVREVLPPALPERFFLYPAQFWQHKNHVGLLAAMARLNRRGLRTYVVFCGAAKNAGAAVARRISELALENQVRTLGFVSDEVLCALYQRAVALVMPTFFGPTNIPPLEALALDCPVAVSRIYGMEEQLGDAAMYFDPADPEAIATVMERLWTDPAAGHSLVRHGRERLSHWTFADYGRKLDDILWSMTTGRR